jgi:TP901 family phage tail tape measure protein
MRSFVEQVRGQMAQLEQTVRRVGIGLTAGVTLPFAGLMATSVRGAANFQSAMNKVNASMRDLNPQQLKEMGRLARELGPQVGMGATQAASAIESLALAGMSAANIMNGGLRAALTLSAANLGDVGASGAMVQNVLQQFQLSAADLPMVVNRITGALDNSQFGFEDFRLGVAQAGTVASAAGISFEDFTTALAATSSAFASGSDAGTSFKTYINTLTPNSKEAAAAMKLLGISFFDASGRIKPLAEQAELLRTSTANLADQARQNVFEEIFGADAARTAIALARTGREEFERMGAAIGRTDASEKLAIQLRGLNGAVGRLKASFEELKIAIGETGLLDFVTGVVEWFGRLVQRIAEANPALLKFGVIVGGLAAMVGPLMLILIPLAKFILFRIAAGFGLIGGAIRLILFPIATLVEWLTALGASALLRGVFAAVTGPIGIAIGAFLLFKDQVIGALSSVWSYAKETLGPPIQALVTNVGKVFAAVGNLFTQIANGPIGQAISAVLGFLGELRDVIGAVIGNLLTNAGELIVNVLSTIIKAVSGMVEAIAKLLSGDFAGAWESAVSAVANFGQGIVDALSTAFPLLSGLFQGIYDLLSGLVQFFAWVIGKVVEFVNGVVGFFGGMIAPIANAVKAIYGAIAHWLYERFGWLYDAVKGIAVAIVSLWNWVKRQVGAVSISAEAISGVVDAGVAAVGGGGGLAGAARGIGRRPAGTSNPSMGGPERTRRPRQARNNGEDLAAKREELRLQQLLAQARAREDHDEVRRIQHQLDRNALIKQYRDLQLSAAEAAIAADRDLAALRLAEGVARTRNLKIMEDEKDLQIAQLNNDHVMVRQLEEQAERRALIARYQQAGMELAQAELRATAALVHIEEARANAAARRQRENEADHQIELARLRGDTQRVRELEREAAVRRRGDEIRRDSREIITEEEARAKAAREQDELEEARQVGNWRSIFRDGLQAAMDNNMAGWLQDRWTEIWSKALENSINEVADVLRDLLKNLVSGLGTGEKDGGILGGLLGSISKLLGVVGGGLSPKGMSGLPAITTGMKGGSLSGLPGFAGGGSLRFLGNGGVDRNLLSMNGSPIARVSRGEVMEVTPANDRGRGGGELRVSVDLDNELLRARVIETSGAVVAAAEPRIVSKAAQATVKTLTRRKLGSG